MLVVHALDHLIDLVVSQVLSHVLCEVLNHGLVPCREEARGLPAQLPERVVDLLAPLIELADILRPGESTVLGKLNLDQFTVLWEVGGQRVAGEDLKILVDVSKLLEVAHEVLVGLHVEAETSKDFKGSGVHDVCRWSGLNA